MNGVGISQQIAYDFIQQMVDGKKTETMGVNGQAYANPDEGIRGIWVASVQPNSVSEQAGIKSGDIILKLNDQVLATDGTMAEYCDFLRSHDAKKPISFDIFRSSTGEFLEGQIPGFDVAFSSTPHPPNTTPEAESSEMEGVTFNPDASKPGEIYYDFQRTSKLEGWEQIVTNGDPMGVITSLENGKNQIEIDSLYTYSYYIFERLNVNDARLEIQVTNLGVNNNNISLICRYSENGWYEFNVASNGLYWIYRYDPLKADPYVKLWNGGSRQVKMGQEENTYVATCDENKLTLEINGAEVISVTDDVLTTGKVGLSVSSYNVAPSIVKINRFTVSVPQ